MGLVSEDGGRTAGSPGYVYLIQGPDGLFKIGRSVNPIARMSQIAPRDVCLQLVSYIPSADCVWLERFVHEAYSHRRVKLEWFRLSPGDVEDFKTIGEADDIDDLPSWLVARRVLNESNGFEWGEHDPDAAIPKRQADKVPIQFFTNGVLIQAIQNYLDSRRDDEPPSKRVFLETAIREALEKRGFWPPPDGA